MGTADDAGEEPEPERRDAGRRHLDDARAPPGGDDAGGGW
jgi:hypothetical protein